MRDLIPHAFTWALHRLLPARGRHRVQGSARGRHRAVRTSAIPGHRPVPGATR